MLLVNIFKDMIADTEAWNESQRKMTTAHSLTDALHSTIFTNENGMPASVIVELHDNHMAFAHIFEVYGLGGTQDFINSVVDFGFPHGDFSMQFIQSNPMVANTWWWLEIGDETRQYILSDSATASE